MPAPVIGVLCMNVDMEEKYDTYAYFYVADFECEPDEITHQMGITPTEVTLKGQLLKNGNTRKRSFWKFHSSLPRSEPYQDEHLSNLLPKLLPKKSVIDKLGEQYKVGINCVGFYTNTNSGFHLSAELISACAKLGVSVDFDLYNFSTEAPNA